MARAKFEHILNNVLLQFFPIRLAGNSLLKGIAAFSAGTDGDIINIVAIDGKMGANQRPQFGVINPAAIFAIHPWATVDEPAAGSALQAVAAACTDLRLC
jgi:hypothetical protein